MRFAEAGKINAIKITISGEEITLSIGDCIKFDRTNFTTGTNEEATVKITGFGVKEEGTPPNRIFYRLWREEERDWARPAKRYIGLNDTYMNDFIGDSAWSTITPVSCPTEISNSAAATSTSTSGGRRRNRRGSKTARKGRSRSRSRSSRRRHTHKH